MFTKTIMKMNFFLAAPGSAWQRSAALFTWSLEFAKKLREINVLPHT